MSAITIAEFEAALDTHGPDLDRWPMPARAHAANLLAASEIARQLLAAAQTVDAVLNAPDTKAPQGRTDRIIDQALGKRRPD